MSLLATLTCKARSSSYLALAIAVVMGCFVAPVNAAPGSGSFNVTATLLSSGSSGLQSVFCTSNPGGLAFGATVTVVCSTGAVVDISPSRTNLPWAPMHGGAYRYILQAGWCGDDLLDPLCTTDRYVGAGITTSWRVVNLAGREYLEMLLGW